MKVKILELIRELDLQPMDAHKKAFIKSLLYFAMGIVNEDQKLAKEFLEKAERRINN